MSARRLARTLLAGSALLASAFAAPSQSFQTTTAPTADPPRRLQILINQNLGGLAVDRAGNRYFSASRYGSVSMIPSGDSRAITILDQGIVPDLIFEPGDIELSASGRALLVADGSGRVLSIPFGLTVELMDGSGLPRTDCTLYVQTDEAGTSAPVRYSGGFYTVPRLMTLDPAATEQSARVVVECGSSPTRAFDVGLGQPDGLFGQTFVRLVVP
jgi:hypothetical protein